MISSTKLYYLLNQIFGLANRLQNKQVDIFCSEKLQPAKMSIA